MAMHHHLLGLCKRYMESAGYFMGSTSQHRNQWVVIEFDTAALRNSSRRSFFKPMRLARLSQGPRDYMLERGRLNASNAGDQTYA
jgi:hypothetical protein